MELIIRSNHMQEVEGITASFPYVLNRVSSMETRVPWHWHEEVEFTYVRSGSLRVTIAGRRQIFAQGEGLFLNSNVLHAMEPAEPAAEVLWDSHMFHSVLLGGHFLSIFPTQYLDPILKSRKFDLAPFRDESPRQHEILQLLRQAAVMQDQSEREFRIRNLFSDIWLLLRKELADLENCARLPKPVSQERIQIMLEYIHQHYAEKLTLDQIAGAALVSRRECLRCFQSCIQKTPFSYLLDYRVQMAERLLRSTHMSITEIAMETGFTDGAYFSKMFRTLRGVSPRAYRQQFSP